MFKSRYRRILWFSARMILSLLWWDIVLPRLGLGRLARKSRPQRWRRTASGFRALAVQMGGVLIKVGQLLSSRQDVLPREITSELADLQDEVGAEAFADIRRVIEDEFSAPLEDMFSDFEEVPLASASIGQVHRARLRPSSTEEADVEEPDVVVKVQRLHIEEIVRTDLAALSVIAGWLNRLSAIRRRANVPALVAEFSRILDEEINYQAEGENAETFAADFKDFPGVRVPHIHWSHTTRRVLTLENVYAIKITDYAAIEAAGVDRADVAERLFKAYLKQMFEDRFFHADPHPGNIFVLPLPWENKEEKREWQLVFVDFGMAGRVSARQFAAMREGVMAIGMRDPHRAVKACQMFDVLLPGTDLELLEKASGRILERLGGKSTLEMMSAHDQEVRQLVAEFSDLFYEMPFQAPQNLILLGRCLSILSGIATGLNPQFNPWISISPYALRLLREEEGGAWEFWLKEAAGSLRSIVLLPQKTETLLAHIEQGRVEVRSPELREQLKHVENSLHRLGVAILFAAFLVGSIQLFLAGYVILAIVLGGAALVTLIGFVFSLSFP